MNECEYSWKRERELTHYAGLYAQEIFTGMRRGEYIVYNLSVGDLDYYVCGRGGNVCVYVYHRGYTTLYATLDRSANVRHSATWNVRYYSHGEWVKEHEKNFRGASDAVIQDLRSRKLRLLEARLDLEEADRLRRVCLEEYSEEAARRQMDVSRRVEELVDWLNALQELEAVVEFGEDGPSVRWCSLPTETDGLVDPFEGDETVKDTELERNLRGEGGCDDSRV